MTKKVYVSYVTQGKEHHIHQSQIIEVEDPAYSYSPDTLIQEIINWKSNREKTTNLSEDQQIIILNFFVI